MISIKQVSLDIVIISTIRNTIEIRSLENGQLEFFEDGEQLEFPNLHLIDE